MPRNPFASDTTIRHRRSTTTPGSDLFEKLCSQFSSSRIPNKQQTNLLKTTTTNNNMCRQVECPNCHKPTWTGCGKHIRNALSHVPNDRRCPNWVQGVSHPCTGEAHAAWTHETSK